MKKPLKIALAGRKGGVGKTTLASGIASLSASLGQRTLVIDLDPQANLVWGLGGEFDAQRTSYHLLTGQKPSFTSIQGEDFVGLSGSPMLKEEVIAQLDPESLDDALGAIEGFDVIIIDCPPNLDRLERLGLVAADIVFVVMDAHPFAQVGAQRVLEYMDHRAARGRKIAERVAVIINRVDPRRALDRVAESLTPRDTISHFTVRQDAKLSTATAFSQPIMDFAPKARAVEDLKAIWEWVYG